MNLNVYIKKIILAVAFAIGLNLISTSIYANTAGIPSRPKNVAAGVAGIATLGGGI